MAIIGPSCKIVIAGIWILFLILILRTILLPFTTKDPCFEDHFSSNGESVKKLQYGNQVINRFRKGLQLDTVCWDKHNFNREKMKLILSFIQESYPNIHSSPLVDWEVMSNYSMLYKVKGTEYSLIPYILLAHLDVVPVENQNWKHPPFAADVVDGYIYARGTIDNKQNVFGILEALETLLKNGYKPVRTFYIAFGHDEECLGHEGALETAKILEQRKVHFEFVLDEGPMVLNHVYFSINKPVAHIGVTEKGHLTVQLTVNFTGGHSSMPLKESSIGILAKAVTRLGTNSHPSMLGQGIESVLLESLAYHVAFPVKVIFRNIWFFRPLLSWFLSMSPMSNAVIRTTTAVTKFNSGTKSNVIPTYVEAIVNHRIHSAQSVEEVYDYDRVIINDDRVKMKILDSFEPISTSCYNPSCSGYQIIKETIRKIWPYDTIVVPAALTGNTDSRHFSRIADNAYRFNALQLQPQDLSLIHGEDERISLENYERVINFYYNLILTADRYHIHDATADHSEL